MLLPCLTCPVSRLHRSTGQRGMDHLMICVLLLHAPDETCIWNPWSGLKHCAQINVPRNAAWPCLPRLANVQQLDNLHATL